jgi:NAD(P)-dependent dehydrogenase (short-subunit alcohol dehydrogenase family)
VAIVTGATLGIGKACVIRMAEGNRETMLASAGRFAAACQSCRTAFRPDLPVVDSRLFASGDQKLQNRR